MDTGLPASETTDRASQPCAGGIVIGDGGMIALVRNQTTTLWFFPKGGIEEGEADEEAARREIHEEAGLTDLEYIDDLGIFSRPRRNKDESYDESTMKHIRMFLFSAPSGVVPRASHEIAEARWFPYREVAAQLEDAKEKVWFSTVFDRVREAIQRD
jgi:ADP-ribose pyrophosphatase YjhB (NUDIX family)